MIIECDGCAKEISKESAVVLEVGGEVFHFCSRECEATRRITEPLLPEEEDREKASGETWLE